MMRGKQPLPDYEPLTLAQQLVIGAFLICTVWYLLWRASTLNPDAYAFSWLVYGAEIYGFLTVSLHLFMVWRLSIRVSTPVPPDKTVDVFIPTINEPLSLVRRTLNAALHIDYPHETWLLDDGNRREMAQLAQELGVHYLARGDNRHAKAGNLNHALEHSSGEFIAVFDADHAPHRHFLERTLGYFSDAKVAFVQTPQDFYNLDSYQHRRLGTARRIWTEQSLFFRVIQRGKDYWNAAFFCGSCAVLRRSSLEAIGGFATGTVTEDLHTSLRLHMHGFISVYHSESLAFGLAPDTVSAFLGQRIRWGEGAMKVWRNEGLLTNHRLSWPQRLNYLASVMTYFDGWQKLVFYTAPALVLLTGLLPIYCTVDAFLLHFVPYFILTIWVFEETGRGFGNFLQNEEYNMARFYAFMRATLSWPGGGRTFRVTPKEAGVNRAENTSIIPQYLLLTVNLLAIPIGYLLNLHYQWLPTGGLYANIMWASANAWFAYSLVTFTTHKRHRRLDYRFTLPVPVSVNQNGRWQFGTIDDISSSGFRLYAHLDDMTMPGEVLLGEIRLPGKHMPFKAEIKRLVSKHNATDNFVSAYGCQFVWDEKSLNDQLDQYLFGSGIQWQIQDFQEKSHTPLQRLGTLFQRRHETERNIPFYWSTFVYRLQDGSSNDVLVGLIELTETGQVTRRVLLYHPLNEGVTLNGQVITRSAEIPVKLYATCVTQIETQLSPIFMIFAEDRTDHSDTNGSGSVVNLNTGPGDDISHDKAKTRPRKHGLR